MSRSFAASCPRRSWSRTELRERIQELDRPAGQTGAATALQERRRARATEGAEESGDGRREHHCHGHGHGGRPLRRSRARRASKPVKDGTLATVAQVKAWLGITADTDDSLLQRLVDSASSFVYNYLSLDTFAKSQYDEMYDGTGGALHGAPPAARHRGAGSCRCTALRSKRRRGTARPHPSPMATSCSARTLRCSGTCFPHCRSGLCQLHGWIRVRTNRASYRTPITRSRSSTHGLPTKA
jgi:hypothetical protein